MVMTIVIQSGYANRLAARLGVRPLEIVIIGAGKTGQPLATQMLELGEDVTLVGNRQGTELAARRLQGAAVEGTTAAGGEESHRLMIQSRSAPSPARRAQSV